MSDRSIGVGEGNIPPEVCWGEGLASVALEVGVCANRSRPGVGTPVRKNLIGEGVGGVRSFERLLVISALIEVNPHCNRGPVAQWLAHPS